MHVVIQCAGKKVPGAGSCRSADGRRVAFIAAPEALRPEDAEQDVLYAHPDDESDLPGRKTWRQVVESENARPSSVSDGWRMAGELYAHRAYGELMQRRGAERLFILSAGWGLVRADFRLPVYDITFSTQSAPCTRRHRRGKVFADFNHLVAHDGGNVVFLGGKAYRPLFRALTECHARRPIVLYNSASVPAEEGFAWQRYRTACKTNWHYAAATDLARGRLTIERSSP